VESGQTRENPRVTAVSSVGFYPLEAVWRIDALFEIERTINGESAERRRTLRQEVRAPFVTDLERWLREQRRPLSLWFRGG
jgi:hypothetical protein